MKDSLGDRMKGYEKQSRSNLLRRTPVLIRIDGKAFHTWTRTLKRPFDDEMIDAMVTTTNGLVQNVQNCVCGYTQSDEITLLLKDWNKHDTAQWFDGQVQKICSVSASMATAEFNFWVTHIGSDRISQNGPAFFDSRCFNVPMAEVTNAFIWRQQDAERNSLQMLARSHFSHKALDGVKRDGLHDLLHTVGVNWNDLPAWKKRGVFITRKNIWSETPIFTRDRSVIENLLESEE